MNKISSASFVTLLLTVSALRFGCVEGTLYTVGGTSGWDISSDIDSWALDMNFLVGDSLWFQFSSYESVAELTRTDYSICNTSNPLTINKSGNLTVPLTTAGDRFFASGNSLYCLSGLKLQVHVQANQTATAPAVAPAAEPSLSNPADSSKTNNPLLNSSGTRRVYHGSYGALLWVLLGLYNWCLASFIVTP